MFEDTIKNFPKQLDYAPTIENAENFKKSGKFIVCGMGGSNLAAGIIESWKPKLDIIIHRDYGLPTQIFNEKTWAGKPKMEEAELKDYLVIASSYSGNTQETISAFHEALARKLPLIAITTGGELLKLAKDNNIPYIQLPDMGIHPVRNLARAYAPEGPLGQAISNGVQPRVAIALSIKATLKAMSEESILSDIGGLSSTSFGKLVLDEASSLKTDDYEQAGKELAEKLQNKMPLIYSSGQNAGLARYWKISFNETAKVPAFYNFLPELNHNEMAGFSSQIFDGKLNHKFAFIFLNDPDDESHIQKRMSVTKKLLEDRGFAVLSVDLSGPSLWHKSFAGILIALWTSTYLAKHYGIDPEDISMIENFKASLNS